LSFEVKKKGLQGDERMLWRRCIILRLRVEELQFRCTDLGHRKGMSQAEGKIPAEKQRSTLENDFHPQQVPGPEH